MTTQEFVGPSTALILRQSELSEETRRLASILEFFGISSASLPAGEAVRGGPGVYCILSSAPCMFLEVQNAIEHEGAWPACLSGAHSVYVYGFQATDQCKRLLKWLTG